MINIKSIFSEENFNILETSFNSTTLNTIEDMYPILKVLNKNSNFLLKGLFN